MGGSNIAKNQDATIEITETGEGKCTFVLPDLTLTGLGNLGTIEVSDVTTKPRHTPGRLKECRCWEVLSVLM